LACGTTGGKILLHSPHEGSSGADSGLPPTRLLNFNKKITALAAGEVTILLNDVLSVPQTICY
jgi:Ciliary BBSome complex subunit 2, N-terminal